MDVLQGLKYDSKSVFVVLCMFSIVFPELQKIVTLNQLIFRTIIWRLTFISSNSI